MLNQVVISSLGVVVLAIFIYIAFWQYKKVLREAKNYERGLKMVPLLIHLPPSSDDTEVGSRDVRDVTEETISQAQILYNIIASTATKGFKSKLYGQRHLAFEVVATKGLIHYFVVVPVSMLDVVKQAVVAAYPTARLEEREEHNIFSKVGRISGTFGGEMLLKKDFAYPIATFQESKRDATQALLNSISGLDKADGAAVQILIRPAPEKWAKNSLGFAEKIRKQKGVGSSSSMKDIAGALWKPPEAKEVKPEDKQLSSLEQATVDAIEDKTRHPGYEVIIRVIASSNTSARSQVILKNMVAAFSLFDSPSKNGFKFAEARTMEDFTTAFILRLFPQTISKNILNSVELATIFHLPDQRNTPTSQLQRQASKMVDGPSFVSETGLLLGYNVFRGAKKQIRLADIDRRRHVYIIGQTGTGKSGLLENLALQDMLDGKGFAFIDPHGDSADRILGMVPKERVEDVIYFSPGDVDHPIGLNLFEFETKEQKDFLIQEAIAMLYRLYDPGHTGIIGPRYEHWFRNGALTVMSDPNGSSFIDIPQVFNDNDFAKAKIKYLTDKTVLDFWNKEMAQTSDYHKSEVLGWFVSKFGAFLSNEMMRNVIGQTKSGFNLREIMDNKKILLVNLSKGKTGELNSQLLGMIFVMKFQAAAMGRANIPEEQREDFSLYVDEFQNFATESFETILSEARKYRLNLILANQFMTQLTDKIREAIIGNVGTVISGRIGTTDAEILSKKFTPTFDAEDLTKLPNFESIASVMINNVPSSAFSMSFIPPLGKPNPQLASALKRLSAAKYGKPRQEVERDIFKRLGAGDEEREAKKLESTKAANKTGSSPKSGAPSFLDEWLAKRKKQYDSQPPSKAVGASKTSPSADSGMLGASQKISTSKPLSASQEAIVNPVTPSSQPNELKINRASTNGTGLTELQKKGIGQNISFGAKPALSASHDLSKHDTAKVDDAINATLKDDVMKNQEVVQLPKKDHLEDQEQGLDEIFIDVRGKIHHKNESPTA
ncbi:MAG TPA: type IV secretory system conjugative DNA transfer family protein [Candidatus Saccharimonadales bacterium]|nr:type IV secretory system conjugative DNA transfer family protein [Candidatus Saccharimonadales bacterium]